MYGDYIAYDCWLGKVYDLKNQIILKLSNGARWVSLHLSGGVSLGPVGPDLVKVLRAFGLLHLRAEPLRSPHLLWPSSGPLA